MLLPPVSAFNSADSTNRLTRWLLHCGSSLMSQMYADKADEDMFLYIKYSSEGTFG
jgi:Autophagy protein Atg8 ubiquitin like